MTTDNIVLGSNTSAYTHTVHEVDFALSLDKYRIGDEDEIVIKLNGRVVKRFNKYQLERAGLVLNNA